MCKNNTDAKIDIRLQEQDQDQDQDRPRGSHGKIQDRHAQNSTPSSSKLGSSKATSRKLGSSEATSRKLGRIFPLAKGRSIYSPD